MWQKELWILNVGLKNPHSFFYPCISWISATSMWELLGWPSEWRRRPSPVTSITSSYSLSTATHVNDAILDHPAVSWSARWQQTHEQTHRDQWNWPTTEEWSNWPLNCENYKINKWLYFKPLSYRVACYGAEVNWVLVMCSYISIMHSEADWAKPCISHCNGMMERCWVCPNSWLLGSHSNQERVSVSLCLMIKCFISHYQSPVESRSFFSKEL